MATCLPKFCLVLFSVSLFSGSTGSAADTAAWPRWRGPDNSGSTEDGNYPINFHPNDVLWKAILPGKGCSTPIILQKTVYLTAPVDGVDALLAFHWSGRQQWQAKFGAENPGKHRNGSGCNASPATDGKRIFIYFKSGTLAAVDSDGTNLWQTNLVERFGKDTLYWDHGTSPVLTAEHVIMARMHHGESWLAAFDKQSGNLVWKVPRNFETPQEGDHGYSSPLVIDYEGVEALLVWGAGQLTIHSPKNGDVLWSCGNFNPQSQKLWPSIAMPVIINDMAVVAYGRNDRGKPRLHGVRLTGSGDVTATNHVWKRDDVGTFVPSPVAYKGRVYLVRDRGEVECIAPETGETIWKDAFPKHRANYYASPLIAGGKLYAAREDGVLFVAGIANEKFELLSENDMQEPVIGSPVPALNRIFIRGEKHLFCQSATAE